MITHNGEITTDVVAAVAVISPLWLPQLQAASIIAGILVPILGATWLFVQIVRALIMGWIMWHRYKSPPKDK